MPARRECRGGRCDRPAAWLPSLALAALVALLPFSPGQADERRADSASLEKRPRIALVLAGGGAKGIAHVGVIKELERAGVRIDIVVGTSMGAIVGGLYAMGHDGDELEKLVRQVDWGNLFVDETPRQDLTIRRKSDDVGFLADARLRIKDGKPNLPQGAIKGQKLALVMRELTRPAVTVRDFDALPRRYRAVAADVMTGDEVVLGSGDLAAAMRASMSVPAVFPPVTIDGRVLVDGGVVNNVPISVARSLGADIIIVSGFTEKLKRPEELTSALSILNQTIDVMMVQATRAQLATLRPQDILILTDTGDITAADFDRVSETVPLGERSARGVRDRLAQVAQATGAGAAPAGPLAPVEHRGVVADIRFEGSPGVADAVLLARMETRPGQPLDTRQLDRDMSAIYGLGMFETVGYRIDGSGDRNTVVIDARPHPSGKDYLRFGARFTNDFNGEATYDFSVAYTRSAINSLNAEWRSQAIIGQTMAVYSEFYQPLDPAGRFHLTPAVFAGERPISLDYGMPAERRDRLGEIRGELRLGVNVSDDLMVYTAFGGGTAALRSRAAAAIPTDHYTTARVSLGVVYDTFDNLNFPRSGVFAVGRYDWSDSALGASHDFQASRVSINVARSWGRNTLVLGAMADLSWDGERPVGDYAELGGPFRLSGLPAKALSGRQALLARAVYYNEIGGFGPAAFRVPLYAGASVEYGGVFSRMSDIDLGRMRWGGSVFVGLDTFIGPLLLGVGITEGGEKAAFVAIGSLF